MIYANNSGFYIAENKRQGTVTVYSPAKSGTHAESDSTYPNTDDGRSLARARCDYLTKRRATA